MLVCLLCTLLLHGEIETVAAFESKNVAARRIDIWLPDGYDPAGRRRYPVLYMHDGQNLFDPATAYGGTEWQVDETLTRLKKDYIVVGIWNTPERFLEYMPEKPYRRLPADYRLKVQETFKGEAKSDAYLRFIVGELKPYVDRTYRTRPGRKHTYIAGSSMGGLISLYAATEYPHVFAGAACLSTHWPLRLDENTPVFTDAMLAYLDARLPMRPRPRLYFDYGTATLDAWYEVHQHRIDALLHEKGYSAKNWTTRKFEGAEHNEKAWAERFGGVAEFLLRRRCGD
jgi:enterochelin esterase-like enzyme